MHPQEAKQQLEEAAEHLQAGERERLVDDVRPAGEEQPVNACAA